MTRDDDGGLRLHLRRHRPGETRRGELGGADIALTAATRQMNLMLACGTTAEFRSAILPDASGDFELRNGSYGFGGSLMATATFAATLSAHRHVSGDQMTLVVTNATAQGAHSTPYQLGRGAPAVTTAYCFYD